MEALIALFILSFALLGLAGVQLKSMQSSNASFKLSIANLAVKDIYALVKKENINANNEECLLPSDVSSQWSSQWSEIVPDLSLDIDLIDDENYCHYNIEANWVDNRFEGNRRYLEYSFII
jgi:type IV pilus assembly protein PilV